VQREDFNYSLNNIGAGPTTYQEERGHPRLRMRHAGFHINPAAKDAWLSCMKAAIDGVEMDEAHREKLWRYFRRRSFAYGQSARLASAFEIYFRQ
jgi:truncated hemoglobin YjbI